MEPQTYRQLKYVDDQFHVGTRGKILQVILGYAFDKAGYRITECQLVEGKDLVFEGEDHTYELEVKTTGDRKAKLGEKDISDIERPGKEENVPGFAILRIHPTAKWWISSPKPFTIRDTESVPITTLRSYSMEQLQNDANQTFPDALSESVSLMKEERYPDRGKNHGDLKDELLNC